MSEGVRPVAYCPTCKRRYSFGPLIVGADFSMMDCTTDALCPEGHPMRLENQEYNTATRRMGIFPIRGQFFEFTPLIETILDDVEAGRTSPEEGLQQALGFLPSHLIAAVQQNAFLTPLGQLRWLAAEIRRRKKALVVAGGLLSAAANVATIATTMMPSSPPAQTIINNNITNVYPPTARDEGHSAGSDPLGSRPGRLDEVERPKNQLHGKGQGKPGKKPSAKPHRRRKP